MAEITITNPTRIRINNAKDVPPMTATAGETAVPGNPAAYDLGATSILAYNADTDDADRRRVVGVFLDDFIAGNQVRIALPGSIVSGYDLDPSSEATHRAGNFVYTGSGGGVFDTPVDGASVPFGVIVPIGQEGYGILVLEPSAAASVGEVTGELTASRVHAEGADPTANDDITLGYRSGDMWVNTSDAGVFICITAADGAADWDELAKV